jgi:hypothetical protein
MLKTISIILGVAIVSWFLVSKFSSPAPDIVARNGLHWHPELSIKILGEAQEIPQGLGLTPVEMPIHTHDEHGIIHLEFSGVVRKDDLRLGEFFKIWGKTFNHDCIFDKCSGSEGRLKMLINGRENAEFGDYMMRDKDKIEIIFE